MTQGINNQLKTMVSSCDHLAKEVRQRGTVRINTDKLTQHCVGVLDKRLALAVEGPLRRLEERLDDLERRVSSLGAKEVSRAVGEVERVTAKIDELMEAMRDAELRIDRLSARVTWVSAGRMCLALLPLAVVLLVVGGLTLGAFHALGVGPILGWAWASFAAAQAWWAKALIALGTLSCVAVFIWLVGRASRWIADEYARW
ncbi:SNARE domain-containing protein [Actinomyces sp. ZJ308]|uniref:SNARE domain-containing protein n=1 Tax=Actinomyces sp. ZJ308 TaxID=2708342 RepID=UPI001420A92B|nr:SNARE domain-containing protein [Actinomyces sp. ZJ308]